MLLAMKNRKMHKTSTNFVICTVQIYNAINCQGKAKQRTTLASCEVWPHCPLNPPLNAIEDSLSNHD